MLSGISEDTMSSLLCMDCRPKIVSWDESTTPTLLAANMAETISIKVDLPVLVSPTTKGMTSKLSKRPTS
jgi:hypothetical protein